MIPSPSAARMIICQKDMGMDRLSPSKSPRPATPRMMRIPTTTRTFPSLRLVVFTSPPLVSGLQEDQLLISGSLVV